MTGLEAGRPFSEIVKEAKALGYTEPASRGVDTGGVALPSHVRAFER